MKCYFSKRKCEIYDIVVEEVKKRYGSIDYIKDICVYCIKYMNAVSRLNMSRKSVFISV